MEQDIFNRRIEAAEKRLAALTDEQRKDSAGLWDELSAALGELRAAGETLHWQREGQRETQMANSLLRSLLDVMPVGIVICDGDGTIMMNNPAAEAILGSIVVGDVHHPKRAYNLYRLDGTPFPAEDVPLVQALEKGEVVRDVEILIRRADGEEHVILAGAAPVRNNTRRVISGVAVFQDITSQKQAEEAMENLARFPSENPNPVLRVMGDGTILYSNQGAQCLLNNWGAQVGEHVPDEWQTLIAEALEAGLDRTAETLCNGRAFTFTIVPVVESGYVNLYGLDITERKRAEEALCETRDYLDSLLTYASAPIIVWNPDFKITRFNAAFERLTGRKADDVCGKSLDILFPEGSKEEALAHIRHTATGEHWEGVEIPILRVDGTVRTVLWNSATLYAADGTTVVTTIAQGQDITERKQAEESLLENEVRLKRAQEIAHLGSWELHVVNNVLTWSDEVYRIFGLKPQEFGATYEAFLEAVHPDDRTAVDAAYSESLQEGRDTYEIEHRIVRKTTGEVRNVHEKCAHIRDETGRIIRSVGMVHDVTERRQAREERERLLAALDQERRTLRAIMENTPIHLAYLDPQFNFVMVNSAYARGAGCTEEQLVGRGHFELFPHEENQAIFERVRETGEPVKFVAKPLEFPERPEMGTTYWDWTLAPVKDADERVMGLVLSLMDVTEQEQARQRLRRYADRLRVLHETDQAILSAHSLDEIAESALSCAPRLLEGCVRASVKLYDLEQKEMSLLAAYTEGETSLRKGWRGPMDPMWISALNELNQGKAYVIEDLQAVPATSPVMGILQAERVCAYVSVPLLIEGKLIGSLNFGMSNPGDLTSEEMDVAHELAVQLAIGIHQARLNRQVKQHAEELEKLVAQRTRALRASEARFRAIFEGAGIGVAVLDVEGRVEQSNPALQELLGYSAEELRGRLLTDFSHLDNVMADETLYGELMAKRKGVGRYRAERRYVRRDGRLCWASVTASLVRERRRKPQFVVVMMDDVTEQKQAQEALIQSEKLAITGRLAASLAHEINNPLQSVIGCLGLAQESLEAGNEREVRDLLRIAAEELDRAARTVSDLRDLNQPSGPEDRKPVNVNLQLEHVLMLTKKQCQERRVEVAWRPAEDLPTLMLVPDRMNQAFLNLLLNALDAMPDGGRLRIGTDRAGDPTRVRVTFADTGCGIDSEVIPHLFDPFYTTKAEGLGLGLYITRNIVEEHGGRIEVESKPGEGTTLTVWLPVEEGTHGGES
jgi:PAS domain S-box-containing protein